MLLRQLGDQVLTYQWRGMKRNLSLLTKEIMQLRLNAEIKGVKRELKYAHGTERQLSDSNEKQPLGGCA